MERVLPCTVRPQRASELYALAEERHGGSVRQLVKQLLELSRRHCIRKCGKPCAHDRAIICKGRKGFGLALYVFTYDQRIPTSLWDHHSVLCRGLTVIVRLPDSAKQLEEGASLSMAILEAAVEGDSPLEVAECMPKFFEADPSTLEGLKSFPDEEKALEAVLEKVDGSLAHLHPPRDPETLEIVDGLPLVSSKSVGYSEDILQVRRMLEEQHPGLRLPRDVTSLVVEVVRPEVQVCVPYSYEGFRLLAAMRAGAWLSEDGCDDLARAFEMARPKRLALAELRASGEAASLMDVLKKAEAYVMPKHADELEEGWVVVLRNGLRLKVKTAVWNMVHAWWSNRLSVKTVLPLLEDPRIKEVPFETLRQCLCGPKASSKRHENADALEALLAKLRPVYEECAKEVLEALASTRDRSLKELKSHPMAKIFQMLRGRQGWVERMPQDVDLKSLPLVDAIRCHFLPRAARAERELQASLDAASLEQLETKPLKAVVMCLEALPADCSLKDLEAELGRPIPQELLNLISSKDLVRRDALERLRSAMALRS